MKSVLCLNAGSSSLKFKLFDLASSFSVVSHGICERIGEERPSTPNFHVFDAQSEQQDHAVAFQDHAQALKRVEHHLKVELGILPRDVVAVGHRVVMGKQRDRAVIIDGMVKKEIREGSLLAPLHNPANLIGITAAEAAFPSSYQVAVFDTAFHATMPARNTTYALPKQLLTKHAIRKYGFHGTSYKYLSEHASLMLGKPLAACNLILMHLGAGASICCVKNGQCVDTSMGLTPTAGLVMATRCGDVDPSIVAFLAEREGLSAAEVEAILNHQSGLLGLTGMKDIRDIHERVGEGDPDAKLAIEVFVARIRQYLGAYFFELDGKVDAVVFSAGIGEHDAEIRSRVCRGMEWAGIAVDDGTNRANATRIDSGSNTKVFVIKTDEELSIARQVQELLHSGSNQHFPPPALRGLSIGRSGDRA